MLRHTVEREALTPPPSPDPDHLADECRETAALEHLQPGAVEKDLHLTRLIWGLADVCGDTLLLKGGTCLSKVDIGYHRMSEDADLVIPWAGSLRYKSTNSSRVNRIRDILRDLAPRLGMRFPNPEGERFGRNSHAIWEVHYDGRFPPTTIAVEVAMRPVLRPARRAALRQLLRGPLTEGYADAYCWALDADEVRAEKVRAAYTRDAPEIRDYYDLGLLADMGADFTSESFIDLVDRKLAELKRSPLTEMPPAFGLTAAQRQQLSGPGLIRLTSVLRTTEAPFNLDRVLAHFDGAWGRTR
jgi:predicted nucleotidyltransferase component of viral defense system